MHRPTLMFRILATPLPRLRHVLCATALTAAVAGHAEVIFVGLLVTSDQASFALSESPGGPTTWRSLGQDFAGYKISSFDANADTLTLTKSGTPLVLHLVDDAKVKTARVDISGELTIGEGGKIAVTRATLLFDQENDFPLADGIVLRLTPQRLPDRTIRYSAVFERTRRDGKKEVAAAPTVIALPDRPFSIKVGDLGFSFAP